MKRILQSELYFWVATIGLAVTIVSNFAAILSLSGLVARLFRWWRDLLYAMWDAVLPWIFDFSITDEVRSALSIGLFVVMLSASSDPNPRTCSATGRRKPSVPCFFS